MEKEIAKNIVKELNVYSKTKFNSLGFNKSALQWDCGTYKENVSKFLIKFSFDFKKIMYIAGEDQLFSIICSNARFFADESMLKEENKIQFTNFLKNQVDMLYRMAYSAMNKIELEKKEKLKTKLNNL